MGARRGTPAAIMAPGQLVLIWHPMNRVGLELLCNLKPIDLSSPEVTDSNRRLTLEVPPGTQQLQIRQGGQTILDKQLVVSPAQSAVVNMDGELTRVTARLRLRWNPNDQQDAALEIDGQPRSIDGFGRFAELSITLSEGEHTVRVTRKGYQPFEQTVDVRVGQATLLNVQLQLITYKTMDAQELQQRREAFVQTYTQYQEFRDWTEETDPAVKRTRLRNLLNTLRGSDQVPDRIHRAVRGL